MARKNKVEDTQKIMGNVYDISSKKPLRTTRVRRAPSENSQYKTGDNKRKKHSLSRKKRKRILRLSLLSLFLIGVIFAIVVLISHIFFKVDTVTVEYTNKAHNSKRYYTDEEVELNSSIENGDNLLFLGSSSVTKKLEKNLPYISQANIKKDFPSGVIIELTECSKVYCYKTKSGYYLADENGKFLEKTTAEDIKKYTVVVYKEIEAEKIGEEIVLGKDTDTIVSYLELIRKSGLKITHIDFTDMNDVYMDYDNRIKIHIGKMSDEENGVTAWKKLQLAKKSLDAEDSVNPKQKGTLNMTISKKAYFKAESEELIEEDTTATKKN